jgi:hypothetical protein
MAEETRVDIVVNVSDGGAEARLKSIDDATKELGDQGDKTSSRLENFANAMTGLNQALELSQKLFSVVSGALGSVFDAISQGSTIDDVSQSFARLTQTAGGTADFFLNDLKQATAGTISDFNLQKQAIEGLRAGAKPDELLDLASAARVLAEQGGDLATDFDTLSKAFETGRVQALQNRLGLIDVEGAQESLARSLGKTSAELSNEEKLLASRTALLEAAKRSTAEFGDIQDDAGDKVAQFKVKLENARDQFLKNIGTSKEVEQALDQLNGALEAIDWQATIAFAANFVTEMIKVAKSLYDAVDAVANFTDRLINGSAAVAENQKIMDLYKSKIDEVNEALGSDSPEAIKKAIEQYNKLINVQGQAGDVLRSKFNKELTNLGVQLNRRQQEILRQRGATQELTGANEALSKTYAGQIANAGKVITEETKIVTSRKNAVDATKSLIEKEEERQRKLEERIGKDVEKIFAEEIINAEKAKQEEIDETNKRLEEQVNIIGDIAGSLLEGDFVGAFGKIGKQLGEGLSSLVTGGLDLAFGLPGLGGTIDQLTGGLVSKLGEKVGSLVDKILGKSESAATRARKAADKFFIDAFDANRLGIILNGELVKVSDLAFKGDSVFGGNQNLDNGSFVDFFQSLPPLAREAFDGVGKAFESLLDTGGDISNQIAAVFANNIGGGLNNLQLLVKASGVSFEELAGQIEQSFLKGELSALQAQSALQGIATIAEDGIPGALGAVDEAFTNLIAAGTKGGATLIDALQDIGFEARKLGISDFGALEAEINRRIPGSEATIRKLFEALQATGVGSVEALTNATVKDLLPALAQLEAQDFPFNKESKNIEDLIKQVNAIPNRIEKSLTLNVRTNADATTRQLGAQGAFQAAGIGQVPGLQ